MEDNLKKPDNSLDGRRNDTNDEIWESIFVLFEVWFSQNSASITSRWTMYRLKRNEILKMIIKVKILKVYLSNSWQTHDYFLE
jgi:hypothetical protein